SAYYFAVRADFDACLFAALFNHGFVVTAFFFPADDCSAFGVGFNSLLDCCRYVGSADAFFFFFFCRKRCPTAERQDRGDCYCWNDVFHLFSVFLLLVKRRLDASAFVFARRAAFTRMRIRQRNCESFLGFNAHCLPPKMKSSKRVTLSAFVQTPTPPASVNVSSSTSNSLSPLKNTVNSLLENSTRSL